MLVVLAAFDQKSCQHELATGLGNNCNDYINIMPKHGVDPENILPLSMDDLNEDERKNMEQRVKEFQQEMLLRSYTKTRQGVSRKPGPPPKVSFDEVNVDDIALPVQKLVASSVDQTVPAVLNNKLESTVMSILARLAPNSIPSTSQTPVHQIYSRTDGAIPQNDGSKANPSLSAGLTAPSTDLTGSPSIGQTGPQAGLSPQTYPGLTGPLAGLTGPLTTGQTGPLAGQTGAMVPVQEVDPLTNNSVLHHYQIPPVTNANPHIPPPVPNVYNIPNHAYGGYPQDVRHGQYNHISPLQPHVVSPPQQRPENIEERVRTC